MNSQVSLSDRHKAIVLDASVLINLNATGCGKEILSSVPQECITPTQVIEELNRGAIRGHSDCQKVEYLLDGGQLIAKSISVSAEELYESLIAGDAATTLDDGEAATIALASELGAAAIIDERKALKLCERRFPNLPVVTTPDLLLGTSVKDALGCTKVADALFKALTIGRMRVPARLQAAIIDLIGIERAALCTSLPKRVRPTDRS